MSTGEVYYADDGTASMVLDAKIDPNYEPSKQELEDHAQWLGIDPEKEPQLLYIAREGLKAPLPADWKPCKTDSGDVYYFNFSSGESIWEHPLDEQFKKKVEEARERLKQGLPVGPEPGGSPDVNSGLTGSGKSRKEDKKKDKKEKKEKDERKSGLATVSASASASPRSNELPQSLPKVGRLGALGTGGAGVKPDITGLVPETAVSTVPKHFALSSTSKETKDTSAEDDKRLRETLQKETDEHIAVLRAKNDERVEERREAGKRSLAKLREELDRDAEDAAENERLAAERRARRELTMFEDAIERQLDDLRRTVRQESQRLEAEQSAADARVEQELSRKRTASDAAVETKVAARRAELRTALQQQKTAAEAAAEEEVSRTRREVRLAIDAAADEAAAGNQRAIVRLREANEAELQGLRERLAAKHSESIHAITSSQATSQSSAYATAETDYRRAVENARDAATKRVADARASIAAQRDAEAQDHARRLAAFRSQATSDESSARAAVLAELQKEAHARIHDVEEVARRDFESRQEAMVRETNEMAEAARAEAEATARASQSAAAANAHRFASQFSADETKELEELELEHTRRLSRIRETGAAAPATAVTAARAASLVEERKAAWLASNPAPAKMDTPPTTTNSKPSASSLDAIIAAEDAAAGVEADRRIAALERELEEEYRATVQTHAAKARAQMEARLETYAQDRRRQHEARVAAAATNADRNAEAEVGPKPSPIRITVRATELTPESHARLAVERARLQANLDAVARAMATAPRPASASPAGYGSQRGEIPQLLSSGSLPSTPSKPPRPALPEPHTYPVAAGPASSDGGAGGSRPGSAMGRPPMPPSATAEASEAIAVQERRVERAKQRIREEKHSLRERQEQLEAARAEWRRDMRRAKDRGDARQQQLLHVAKGVLEERARVLNQDTAALRETVTLVRQQSERLSDQRARLRPPPSSSADDGSQVHAMLQALVAKVDHCERSLQRSASQAPVSSRARHSPTRRTRSRERRREDGDPTTEKWQRYMQPSRGHVQAEPPRHVDVVNSWLSQSGP